MSRRVIVALVAAHLVSVLGGCSSSDSSDLTPGTEGAACRPDGSCRAGLACEDGRCRRAAEAGPVDLGPDSKQPAPDATPDAAPDADAAMDAALPCSGNEVEVYQTRVNAPAPGSITLVVGVETCAGAPVAGLAASEFSVAEDGQPVAAKPVLLERHPEVYLSLLIDASPSLAAKPGALDKTVIAAKALATQVLADGVWISVTHFAETAKLVQPFTRDKSAVHAALEAVASFNGASDELDLYGALVSAIEASDQHRAARRTTSREGVFALGQLLLFTDGADKAAQRTLAEAAAAVDKPGQDVVTVGLGAEIDGAALTTLGTHGAFVAKTITDLKPVFAEAATRLEQLKQRVYVLGHCSKKTAGEHTLVVAAPEAQSEPVTFDAGGFDPGACSASGFADACDGISCGGLLCGGCSADLWCTANGLCTKCDAADVCKIDEQCLKAGQVNPLDACQSCDPSHAKDSWKISPGASCGDQCVDLQTDGAHCGECGRSCKGDPCVAGQCTALVLASASAAATSLAVDGDEAFWTEGDEVKKVATTGGTPTVLVTGENNPREVLVISQAVVWIADKGGQRCLRSLPPGGSAASSLYCSTFHPTLTSDGSKIKFVWGSQVGTTGPAGGLSFAQASVFASVQVVDLHYGAGQLHWIDSGGKVGTEQKVLASSSPQGTGITVVGGKPYWARIDAAAMKGSIMSLDSAGAPTTVATDQQALGLATDDQSLYWANTTSGGAVIKLDLAAGTPASPLVTGEPNPRAVVTAGEHVYWLSDVAVKRVAR